MRKVVLLTLTFVVTSIVWGQEREALPGFWGIPWDTDHIGVRAAVEKKGNYELIEGTEEGIMYKGLFGGAEATIIFFFYQNKIERGAVIYDYESNSAFSTFYKVKDQVIGKYGQPSEENEVFKSPYYKGDGYEELAVKLKKAIINATWDFKDGNEISIFIATNLEIYLLYDNTSLLDAHEREQAATDSQDF